MNDQLHRPIYHFLPPANWMNDPNGLIQWGDTYHLFYQHNPYAATHSRIHWGHATSPDLVHWQHEPIALTPDENGPDAGGCWSGCAVNDHGTPTLVYTGFRDHAQTTCVATSSDNLRTWQKHPANPVIAEPPPNLDLLGFRDHSIWRESGMWMMVIGSGIRGHGGAALLYRSADLRTWEYLHPLAQGADQRSAGLWTGTMWECPDFFNLEQRHVMTVSVWDADKLYGSAVMLGQYAEQRFQIESAHMLDYGENYFYAPQSFSDNQGRRIIFGWAMEGRSSAAQVAAGWAGVMSLPRELSINRHGQVIMRPLASLNALRRTYTRWRGRSIRAGAATLLPDVHGAALELAVELHVGGRGECGVAVRTSPDGEETTRIVYQPASGELILDRSQSSRDPELERRNHCAPLRLAPGEPLRLRIFVDHSMLEVFANDRVALTSRIYPTRPDSLGVALISAQSDAWLVGLDAWQLTSIWPD